MRPDAQIPGVPSRELQLPGVTSRNFRGHFWLDGAWGRKEQGGREQREVRRGLLSGGKEGVRSPRERGRVSPALSHLPVNAELWRGWDPLDDGGSRDGGGVFWWLRGQ